ncbi:RNA 3'-terminal phosphate cyclase [Enhygromyxa salina]|uniref:RNA 3'-terminal phosphate cyclase n=1 Tax=Enhygromyxa salina TaxID=215803 RepID=A0A0C2D934_9BACT|nr:RNA 3'-terminal phosphate cyclase [Enhygromyxa salina]KIG16492.1 RNA 3'-terminal phosphate cyclase [Enhygromyxa salina]
MSGETETIVIDGSQGEGGGQVLRTSLALAAVTGAPLRIVNIRSKRRQPGLMRQHLAAVRAAAEVSGATVRGDELRSLELEFIPGPITHGERAFRVGTAGSATLVFQTVVWPLLATPGRSLITFEGGTHNPMAPPFEFLQRVFLPHMRRLGLDISATLEQAGFFPAGGGRFVVELEGGYPPAPVELDERGEILSCEALAFVANLPSHIANRELVVVRRELNWAAEDCHAIELEGRGPGNALCLLVKAEGGAEVATGFGEKGLLAELVAERACAQLRKWLDADVPVGEHLADQLLIPMGLAAAEGNESVFLSTTPTLHAKTNAQIIARFLPVEFEFEPIDARRGWVRARPR